MDGTGGEYAIRYGWNGPATRGMATMALVLLASLVPGAIPPAESWVRVLLWLVAGPVFLVMAVQLSFHHPALLIGPNGITLGSPLFLRRRRFLPWSAISAMGLDRGRLGKTVLSIVWFESASAPAPAVAEADLTNCRVDLARFRGMVDEYAPDVGLFVELG
ncbi:hypothetical protein [Streptomyces sp. NPDC057257]|uniref:hypothetical protein n=1 Tax=Streptomyces sp. NPDC057257 TaxID=3346071 RepID=UPI00362BFB69